MTENSDRTMWLQDARAYLRKADPVLAGLIDDRPTFDPRAWMSQLPAMDLYGALLFQITGQQLSVAATRRTLARIEALFDGHLPSPTELLQIDPGKLREAGLSWRKINTLRDLAARLSDGRLDANVLSALPDDELMAELTTIPGIGPWTVQGALIIASSEKTSSCPATSRSGRPFRPRISSTTSPRTRKCSPSPRNGGRTAALRPVTCSPPPLSGPEHHPRDPERRREPELAGTGRSRGTWRRRRIGGAGRRLKSGPPRRDGLRRPSPGAGP